MKSLSKAIRAIDRSADRQVRNQVWYFLGTPNDLKQLRRLRGIDPPDDPLTDPYLTYRVRESFAPVPDTYIAALEASLNAELPAEYKLILSKYGPIHLPGERALALIDPSVICASVLLYDLHPWDTPMIPIAHFESDPDAIGLIRDGNSFTSSVYRVSHTWYSPDESTELVSDSFAEFIVHLLENETPSTSA